MQVGLLQPWSGHHLGAPFIWHVIGVAISVSPPGLAIRLRVLKPLINPLGELIELCSQGVEVIVVIRPDLVDDSIMLTQSLLNGGE